AIVQGVDYVLQTDAPDADALAAARATLRERLLTELSSAYAVSSLVQVPVTVASPLTDATTAPRLFGQPFPAAGRAASDFAFSTGAVPLAAGARPVTFLFTVKTPADDRQVDITVDYQV